LKQLRNVQAKVGRQFSRLFQVGSLLPHHHNTHYPPSSRPLSQMDANAIAIAFVMIDQNPLSRRRFRATQQGARCG
jgi:hypothetical protein